MELTSGRSWGREACASTRGLEGTWCLSPSKVTVLMCRQWKGSNMMRGWRGRQEPEHVACGSPVTDLGFILRETGSH